MKKAGSANDPLWYKDALLYELHVRSFADSNGDGIGDFPGLTGKLDYLQNLGVTCLWLLPFFPSPLRDDGYDIANYTDVHPSYGTLDDFMHFLEEAHGRGMQVLIELVMNHTSDQHPWFQRARHAPAGSPERNFYVWSDDNTRFPDVRIIFNDTENSNWAWDEVAGQYYWHRFFSHQPDLNFDNPQVQEEMMNVMRFWLDCGVDALRFDAIPYLVERDGTHCENLPETHTIIRSMRSVMDAEYANRFILAEANQWPSDVRPYFGEGDECHMAFHFPLMPRMYVALRQENRQPIVEIMQQTPSIPNTCQWGLFLRNHDELTLEMVTRDERDYMYLAYSSDPRMRINLGIRRRLAPLLDNNRQRIELLISLLFSFPGTPILYYGDEIGMGDNLDLGDRNGVRTPMQWSSEPNGGFSSADPANTGNPVISDPVYGYQAVNVAEQAENPSSLLQWTRNMIRLRRLFPVFGRGTQRFLSPENQKVLAYIRRLGDESVLCIANLSRFAQPVTLDLSEFEGRTPVEMLGYTAFPPIADQPYSMTLSPYAFLWFELQSAARMQQKQRVAPDMEGMIAAEPVESLTATTEIHEGDRLVIHLSASGPDVIRSAVESFTRGLGNTYGWHSTLAFPFATGGNDELQSFSSSIRAMIPAELTAKIDIAGYQVDSGSLPPVWPHSVHSYLALCSLAEEHHADAVLMLNAEDGILPAEDLVALGDAILRQGCELALPDYLTSPYEGLLNSGVLYPLTRTIYGADIRFPLATDVAFSSRFCNRLSSLAHLPNSTRSASILNMGLAASLGSAPEDQILWPSIQSVLHGDKIAQVHVGARHFQQYSISGLTQLIAQVLNSLFSEIERSAIAWQSNNSKATVVHIGRPAQPAEAESTPHPDETISMQDSFRLAAAHLEEVWSQVLAPGTMLALKRIVERAPSEFLMPNGLWVRILYEYLAAFRNRRVNRQHLSGALVPLYFGWAASYVLEVSRLSAEQVPGREQELYTAFEANKQYLMSLWRWPDRFNP